MPTWLLFVILLIVIAIIIWILVSGNPEQESVLGETRVNEPVTEEPLIETVESVNEIEESLPADLFEEDIEVVAPDDLKKIEGIGPKISSILAERGILTFAQLAQATEDELITILDEAKIRIANPATWAEQAKLAAEGQWEALENLQDSLKGGRRV